MLKKQDKFFIIFLIILSIIYLRKIIFTADIVSGLDLTMSYYPMKYFTKIWIIKGEIPLWNPHTLSGMPFLATMQPSFFYPIGIIFYIFNLNFAFNFFIFIHFILVALFFYLIAKKLELTKSSAFISSLVFTFSGFMILKILQGLPIPLSGYIWLPIIWLFVIYNQPLFLSLSLSSQISSGHIQPVFMTLLFITAFIFLIKRDLRSYVSNLNGFISSFLMSAIVILPVIELSNFSIRKDWNYYISASYSFPPQNLITFLFPNLWGNPVDGSFKAPASVFFETNSIYIGLIPFLLAVFWIFTRQGSNNVSRISKSMSLSISFKNFLILTLIISFLLAFGLYTPFYYLFYKYLPFIENLRVPSRFLLISTFILSIFSGFSLMTIRNSKIFFFIIFLIVFDLFNYGNKFIYTQKYESLYRKTEAIDFLMKNSGIYRIMTDEDILHNKVFLFNLFNIQGYEGAFLKKYGDYISKSQGKESTTIKEVDITNYTSNLIKLLGAKYIITTKNMSNTTLKLVFKKKELNIYEQSVYPRVFLKNFKDTKTAKIEIIEYTPNKIRINSSVKKTGDLILTDIFYPGWEVFVNGKKEKLSEEYIFRSVCLKEKENRIVFLYSPFSFNFGLTLSIITLIYFLVMLYRGNLTLSIQNLKIISVH